MSSPEHARSLLSSAMSQAVTRAIRDDRSYRDTLAEQGAKDGEAVGFINVSGGEESVSDIEFPIKFYEKPVFTAGLELPDNVWLSWGAFPQWSAVVASWRIDKVGGVSLYSGCTLGVRLIGPVHAVVHYRFAARALTNPVGNTDSVTGVM